MIVASVNSHLVNTHDLDSHSIYNLEEDDYFAWKILIAEWFEPTDKPYSYRDGSGKLRIKKPKKVCNPSSE